MDRKPMPRFSTKSTAASKARLRQVSREDILAVLERTAGDRKLWENAKKNPRAFLRRRGITIPEGVEVSFEDRKPIPPGPDNPPAIDFKRLGIIGWRCIKWCHYPTHNGIVTGPMVCEDICLPLFKRRLGRGR